MLIVSIAHKSLLKTTSIYLVLLNNKCIQGASKNMNLMEKATIAFKKGNFRDELKHSLKLKRNRMDLIWSFKAGNDITSICKVNYCSRSDNKKQLIIGSRDHRVYSLSIKKRPRRAASSLRRTP